MPHAGALPGRQRNKKAESVKFRSKLRKLFHTMENFVQHTIILAILLFVAVPAAIALLTAMPGLQKPGIFAAMLLLVLSHQLGLNYMADPLYVKGTTQAYEITFLDFFAIIYFAVLSLKRDYKFKFFPPGTAFFLLFLMMCVISTVNAPNLQYSAFEIFRLVKMGFFMTVMYNILIYYNCYSIILNGLAIGLLINLADVLFQKYIQGYYAPVGFLRHKNNAGMYTNMLMPIYLFIFLNLNFDSAWRRFFYAVVFFGCAMSVVATVSRGAWGAFAVCFTLTMAVSLIRGVTSKKLLVVGATVFAMILGVIKSYDTIYERLTVGNEVGTSGRISLVRNAVDMANKNFLGVGINNYSAANTPESNYGEIYDNLNPSESSRGIGKVETVYLLTAAECGWLGLAAMLLWYFYYLFQALKCAKFYWRSNMAYLAIGLSIALFGAYVHSTLEWILRYSAVFYLLMVLFAMVASLAYFKKNGIPNGTA